MLSSYPSLGAHDPKGYAVSFIAELSQYPLAVIEAAIKAACRASPQFIPSVPAIEAEAAKLFAGSREALTYAADWDTRSKTQLEERKEIEDKAESLEHRKQVVNRIRKEMADAGMPIMGDKPTSTVVHNNPSSRGVVYNVFVPTFAPQYADMVARGGRPGVSLEDKTRKGVWVPHAWLDTAKRAATWKRFDDTELLRMYAKPEAPPPADWSRYDGDDGAEFK